MSHPGHAVISSPPSREANYRDVSAALIAMFDGRLQSGSKAVEDNIRREQIGSGMRGDKRRPYRFQADTCGRPRYREVDASEQGNRGMSC